MLHAIMCVKPAQQLHAACMDKALQTLQCHTAVLLLSFYNTIIHYKGIIHYGAQHCMAVARKIHSNKPAQAFQAINQYTAACLQLRSQASCHNMADLSGHVTPQLTVTVSLLLYKDTYTTNFAGQEPTMYPMRACMITNTTRCHTRPNGHISLRCRGGA